MTNRHPVRVAAAVALATLMFSPGGAVAAAPDDRSIVCHPTAQAGLKPMSLSPKGVAAHVAHGDGTPGDEVRGEFGVVLDEACGLVPSLLVTVAGPEGSPDAIAAISAALDALDPVPDIPTRYIPVDDIDALVGEASATGEQPMLEDPVTGHMVTVDVLVVSQPGAIAPLVASGAAVPAATATIATATAGWDDDWLSYGRVDGELFGVPTSSGLKSLVWFKESTFVEPAPSGAPYDIPETWEDLVALTDTMIGNGQTPWCVGLESGQATGWVFTDWVEDRLLGSEPVAVYDHWIVNDVGFTDARIRSAWNDVVDLWHTEGAVYEGLGAPAPGVGVAQTHFVDSLFNLVGDSCLMHRQGSFSAEIIAGEDPGSLAALSTFPFPADDGAGTAIIGNGHYALALDAADKVALVHEYLTSADYVDARRGVQPEFLSANQGQTLPPAGTLERGFVDQMLDADTVRFDASDSMPEAVGAGPLQTGKKFKFEEYWVFPSQPTGFWGEGLRAVIGPSNTSVEQWLGFEDPNKVFIGDVDGKTVDAATETLADLFCTVAPGGSCP